MSRPVEKRPYWHNITSKIGLVKNWLEKKVNAFVCVLSFLFSALYIEFAKLPDLGRIRNTSRNFSNFFFGKISFNEM